MKQRERQSILFNNPYKYHNEKDSPSEISQLKDDNYLEGSTIKTKLSTQEYEQL